MFNLIPVVMLLLMQGAGGGELSLRQQQALLDIATRAQAARSQGELESVLASEAGVEGAELAFWMQVFGSAGVQGPEPALELPEPAATVAAQPERPSDGFSDSSRPRDGPVLS
jgi:hypothetical protein